MQPVPVLNPRAAADLIADGDCVTVSSSSGLGCPDAVLAGIGQRWQETRAPRSITAVHPIAAGDMYGQPGIDHIAYRGLLQRVIAGSYPSGPSSAPPPRIWQLIADDQVQAYNFPSGVLFQMHRAGATQQPGVLTQVGLGTFADPSHDGGRMNPSTPADVVSHQRVDDQDYLFFRSVVPDVAIIRATTGDAYGNLTFEEEGSSLGALDQAYAAHNNGGIVIAQVKRLAEGGSLDPQAVKVPGILVDVLVEAPDQMQTTETIYDPAISGQLRRPTATIAPIPFSLEKIMARRAAAELRDGETVNLGFGVSALVPHVLVEERLERSVSWVLEQGPVGGIPLLDFAFGCSQNPDALMQSADQFTLLQGGGFHRAFLSFLEIDAHGNVNVHHLERRRHVTAGVGGFADITTRAPQIVFVGSFTAGRRDIDISPTQGLSINADGPHTKLVPDVAAITFNGQQALARGQQVKYVTERCVLDLTPAGLQVSEIAPGVDLQKDVLDRSGFPLLVSDALRTTDLHYYSHDRIGLTLPPRPVHERISALSRLEPVQQ
ncbi:MAG: acyl CoA:acetate/3-ketoacid CoA transferase [Beutenbergiaceae bacterium]